MITSTKKIAPANIIGPYSVWPKRISRRRSAGLVAAVSGMAVFVHCGLPLIA